jgi:hypothetical protein
LELKRAGKSMPLSAVMDKAYATTPADQRTRPLVLNRAIIDLTQRVNVMRAVRELQQYLRELSAPDEAGPEHPRRCLNVAAEMPRCKKSAALAVGLPGMGTPQHAVAGHPPRLPSLGTRNGSRRSSIC